MNPKCELPGRGLVKVPKPPAFYKDPESWVCIRNADAHALCAKLAESEAKVKELEAKLAEEKRRLREPEEGCILVAVDTGEGWCLQVSYPEGHELEGEAIALLAWPDTWPETMSGKQMRTFGFEVC